MGSSQSAINESKARDRRPLRVLFYEPAYTGHHLAYLGRMLPGFFDLPVELGLATTEAAVASQEFQKSIAPIVDRLEVVPACRPRPKNQLRVAWQRYRELASLAKGWRADHVCVAYADGIWQVATLAHISGRVWLPPGVTVEGWIFRGGFSYPGASRGVDGLWRYLFKKMLSRGVLQKAHLEDEQLMAFADRVPKRRTEIALAPDPILIREPQTQSEARTKLELPSDGKLISTSGMISQRKGAEVILNAFAKLLADDSSNLDDVRLLLAGPHADVVKAKLAESEFRRLQSSGRIVSVDRFLNEDEMLTVAEASDLVLAAYLNHSGRSSIILWAAAAGKPVIGANTGTIDYVIRSEQLGTTCDVRSAEEFAAAIRQALRGPWTDEDIRRVQKYAQWHRIENYQQLSSAYTRARC